jgi:hypothetical protein
VDCLPGDAVIDSGNNAFQCCSFRAVSRGNGPWHCCGEERMTRARPVTAVWAICAAATAPVAHVCRAGRRPMTRPRVAAKAGPTESAALWTAPVPMPAAVMSSKPAATAPATTRARLGLPVTRSAASVTRRAARSTLRAPMPPTAARVPAATGCASTCGPMRRTAGSATSPACPARYARTASAERSAIVWARVVRLGCSVHAGRVAHAGADRISRSRPSAAKSAHREPQWLVFPASTVRAHAAVRVSNADSEAARQGRCAQGK